MNMNTTLTLKQQLKKYNDDATHKENIKKLEKT